MIFLDSKISCLVRTPNHTWFHIFSQTKISNNLHKKKCLNISGQCMYALLNMVVDFLYSITQNMTIVLSCYNKSPQPIQL